MIDKHLVKHVIIKNFKCFNDIKVANLGRVNLLGGDNNVGKSAFLEALEIIGKTDNSLSLIKGFRDIINRRQRDTYNKELVEFDVIAYDKDFLEFRTNTVAITLEIKPRDQLSIFDNSSDLQVLPDKEKRGIDDDLYDDDSYIEITINNNVDRITYGQFNDRLNRKIPLRPTRSNDNVDFIPSAQLDERKLSTIYGNIVDMGMMKDIDSFLSDFDQRIESLLIRPTERFSIFKIKLKDKATPVLLSSMGEGVNRYIGIICAIWKSQAGQLFIDEVENGIHYTKYERLWEIIFKTSKEANCQVFAATHSKECIEAFSRMAENYDHKNIKYINFSRMIDEPDEIVATVLDSVGLEDNFRLGLDTR